MEKRDNSGALFTNDKREKETHPHYQGKATIGGVEYYVSAWVKDGQKGIIALVYEVEVRPNGLNRGILFYTCSQTY